MIDMIRAPTATPSAIAANLLAVLEASLAERAISICSALDASSFCASHLILLCHKLALWQQGHRGSRRAIVRANLMRMLVMDDLTWRSVRIGGSAGSKTVG